MESNIAESSKRELSAMPAALELFCGIGGFAAAVEGKARVVGAIDLSPHVLEVYKLNFPDHRARQAHLEFIEHGELAAFEAQIWWMSPPCQPYTTRGKERDLRDHRARSLIHMMEAVADLLPPSIGMENVPGFVSSDAHKLVRRTLEEGGYEIREFVLCPTELGIPARRERFYLVASREGLKEVELPRPQRRCLADFLDDDAGEEYVVPADIIATHGPGMRILDLKKKPDVVANTFTGSYGKTWQAGGSYLRMDDGGVRRFSPAELLRLLDFPREFSFPTEMSIRQRYKWIGNSLSVVAMRQVLRAIL